MSAYVLKGNVIYSDTNRQLVTVPDAFIVCENGISQGVFAELPEKFRWLPLMDYSGCLIIPGLVDLHVHAPQYAFRGLGMDMELTDWLQHHAYPEETKFADLAYAELSYGIFAQNMKNSATTRASIFASRHREATELLMEKLEAAGLVSYVGKVNMNRNAPDPLRETSTEESVRETERWIAETQGKYRHTYPILTPRFLPSCTDDLLVELGKLCGKYAIPMQSHLSENPGEIQWVSELFPQSKFYGDGYEMFGLFGTQSATIMAHCVYSSDAEVELMRKNGVFVAHCPASNTNIASGIAPIRRYLEAGLKVGLGSDVAGGHTESLFRAITDTVQVSKLYWRLVDSGCKPLGFDDAFYLATRGGGEFFGKVGSFEAGYELDAVVLDDALLPHPQELTLHERLERAVYLGLDQTGIRAKFAAGEKVF